VLSLVGAPFINFAMEPVAVDVFLIWYVCTGKKKWSRRSTGLNLCTNKISEISSWQKYFSKLKMSMPRISCPVTDNVVYWKTNGKINNDLQCPVHGVRRSF